MAFLHKPIVLPSMYLCVKPLPWVDELKHLGNMVGNKLDGRQLDISHLKIFWEYEILHQASLLSYTSKDIDMNIKAILKRRIWIAALCLFESFYLLVMISIKPSLLPPYRCVDVKSMKSVTVSFCPAWSQD